MELWLDLRRDAVTGQEGGSSSIAPPRLNLVDALLVDGDREGDRGGDDVPETKRCYAVTDDPDGHLPPKLFEHQKGARELVGAVVDVSTPSGQDAALGLIGSVEWILIMCQEDKEDGWVMIPAENLISSCQGTGTKIAAMVDRAGDVGGLSRALELGVDALCVDSLAAAANDELWGALIEAKEERQAAASASGTDNGESCCSSGPAIVQGTCRRLASSGGKSTVIADRVCIDMVQSLKPTEGCWIGSSAMTMAMVLSEAARSSFVPSRPFRVNAGPVHSYVVMADGSTKYLSELGAGDEVLVYDIASGNERPVAVGRLKVEVRPCVQVGLFAPQSDGREEGHAQIFLQQAETVRLGQAEGVDSYIRVTDLEDGGHDAQSSEKVLLRVVGFGTHVGRAYSGKVTER